MIFKILRLTLHSDAPMRGDGAKLRGFFATSFNEYALLHQHVTDKLIYRYPLIQYKMLEEGPLILGINEGAEVLKEVYDKFDEIKLGESTYSIMERGVILRSEEFGCSQKIQSYRFATPWLALNQKNYDKYRRASREERRDLLRSILVGNILSASKGLGYVAKEHIRLEFGEITEEVCQLKDKKVTGIWGEFTTNFEIPELLGLGKSVSRGFGTVARLR
ncbi:CRISPR-associated endonuclease Cas6 [Methanocrinis sp.]|uniref:CRISPR-associated endonuclease Cas6 n=1 Tax=Methanocrinis sp. TaxID=3101522 RepID=UPI003D1474B7